MEFEILEFCRSKVDAFEKTTGVLIKKIEVDTLDVTTMERGIQREYIIADVIIELDI